MIQLKPILCLVLLCGTGIVFAQETQVVKDYEIVFTIENAGFEVDGSLEGLDARLFFNPQQTDQSYIEATADPRTIQTGIRIRDNHLKRSDYFAAEEYPELKLTMREFKVTHQENTYNATCTLTMKGTSKTFSVPLHYQEGADTLHLSSNFTLNRLDFGIGAKSVILSENVKVKLQVSIVK